MPCLRQHLLRFFGLIHFFISTITSGGWKNKVRISFRLYYDLEFCLQFPSTYIQFTPQRRQSSASGYESGPSRIRIYQEVDQSSTVVYETDRVSTVSRHVSLMH